MVAPLKIGEPDVREAHLHSDIYEAVGVIQGSTLHGTY